MSEFEKLKRDEYQKHRKEIIYFLTAIALILALITASFSIIFVSLDANTYVYYQENGSALYHAYLNDNEYYEEDRLNGNHAYISSLIHHMDVAFRYESKMEAEDVTYQYQYRVDAQLVVEDSKTGAAIYNPVETILGPTNKIYKGQKLVLAPTVEIDYVAYNEKAKEFISQYKLVDVNSYLNVTMYVDVIGMSELFASESEGQYNIQVKIPLTKNVLKPQVSSSIPAGPQKVLSNPNRGKTLFKVLAIIAGNLDVLRWMLDRERVDVNKSDVRGYRPIEYAIIKENLKVVQAMLECERVDVNKPGKDGLTPLDRAIEMAIIKGNLEVLRAMLDCEGLT